ncbi:MAG: ABC transporter ATP-binding protein [Candidatus Njordarchaeales archaeon]
MAFVICEKLIKIYKTGSSETVALRELTMKVREGEFRVIAGPSGSGKTTLLNCIGAIDTPDAGIILVDGEDITKYTEKRRIEYRRKRVGFVFQLFNLIPYLTALENVELPMAAIGIPREERIKRARELLNLVGLGDKLYNKPHELSGGEQQRVAIAVALANDPPLILADEPTGELDYVTGRQIVRLFRDLHRELNKTIIMVTHDISMVTYADRISIMRDGRILETVTPAERDITKLLFSDTDELLTSLEERRKIILEEIKKLENDYRNGLLSLDQLVERYTELKNELNRIEKELRRMSI